MFLVYSYIVAGLLVMHSDYHTMKSLGVWEAELKSIVDEVREEHPYGKEIPESLLNKVLIFSMSILYALGWPVILLARFFE